MKKDLVTIIVPVYNAENELCRCVDSILAQSYKNLEIILIDDGSKDNSLEICSKYSRKDNRIKIFHKNNGGVSSARNFGLTEASGKYICFVDSDDWLDEQYVEALHEEILKNDSDIVIGGFSYVYGNKNIECVEQDLKNFINNKDLFLLLNVRYQKNKNNKRYLKKYIPCYLHRMMFKADALKDKKFVESVHMQEDTLFFIDLLQNKNLKIALLDKKVYYYFVRKDSVSHRKNNFVSNCIEVVKKLEDLIKNEELIGCYKFNMYQEAYYRIKVLGDKEDISLIKDYNSRLNYNYCKKHLCGTVNRVRCLFAHHNWLIPYKIVFGLKKVLSKNL